MQKFDHVVKNPGGLDETVAGMLNKCAKNFPDSTVTLTWKGRAVDLKQLFKLITMRIRQGDDITICVEGGDEETAIWRLQSVCVNYF